MKFYLIIFSMLAMLNSTDVVSGMDMVSEEQKSEIVQDLQLIIKMDQKSYELFQPFDLMLSLHNSGQEPIVLYHPDYIQSKINWNLQCLTIKPDGHEVMLKPETTYSIYFEEKKEDFITLESGEDVFVKVKIGAGMTSSQPYDSHPWVAIIDSWNHAEDQIKMTENYLFNVLGIKGEYVYISGRDMSLAVRDLLKNVFNHVGTYPIHCKYENFIFSYRPIKDNVYGETVSVPGSWTGILESYSSIEIVE